MSRREEGQRRAGNRGQQASSLGRAIQPILETLECRQFLSVSVQGETPDFRLIGITGNQQSELTRYTDETLYDIKFATPGNDPKIMDGWHVPPGAAAGIELTTVSSIPGSAAPLSEIRQGSGALRVSIPQNGSAYWGIRSPNVVDLLAAPNDPTDPPDVNRLTFDVTFIARELNGGSFGGGLDDSYTGYAHSNQLAINLSDGTWIQKTLAEAGEDDQFLGGGWNNSDVTHQLTWNLNVFTAPDGSLLRDYIKAHNITEARIWVVAQGDEVTSTNANGTTGPARIYFDNFRLGRPRVSGVDESAKEYFIGDFDPLYTEKLLTLPFVPDTDAIGYNPEDSLLYRVSGASSYRDDPSRIGYNDNQFMESINLGTLEQHAIFNGNYQGDGTNGIQGLPAPRPNFVLPVERRTPEQNQPAVGDMYGPGEYHAMRDLTWSSTHHAFFGTDETGIYRLTPSGNSTFVGRPAVGGGGPKGITFATVNGQQVLLVSSRDGSSLVTVDPETGLNTGEAAVIMVDARTQELVTGILSLVQAPDGVIYGIRNVRRQGPGDVDNLAFVRELVTIDPVSGEVRSVGALGMHIADLAIAPAAAPATVSEVYVRGTEWVTPAGGATAFTQYLETKGLGDDVYGYRLFGTGRTPPVGNAEDILPWINANQLVVRYSSPPTGSGVPTPGSVSLQGLKPLVSTYSVTSVAPVAGDPTAFILTLNKPLGGGNPTTGVAPTVDENGDQIKFTVPGAGAAGSNYTLTLHVLQGDTDHLDETSSTHAVLARDFAEVKKRFFKDTSSAVLNDGADYSAFHDVDGSGSILARDFAEVKKRFFQTLPPPPAAAAASAGVSITSEIFGSGRILG